MNTFDASAFALASAREAWDQRNDKSYGGSIGKATLAYIVNVRDTLSEYDALDQLDNAILVFCREIAVLAG